MAGKVIHRDGSLFEALTSKAPVLVHAVNTVGVWGAGIALEFKKRFPVAYKRYVEQCGTYDDASNVGNYGVMNTDISNQTIIAWLFTAQYPGPQNDTKAVVAATSSAVSKLIKRANFKDAWPYPYSFHSPRINAGLFAVPWEQTEAAIQKEIEDTPFDWYVWTPKQES